MAAFSILLAILSSAPVDLFTKAGIAYDSGRIEEASNLYKLAGRRGEQPAIAWFNYGNCQARLKHRGEAAAAWRKALEWAPRFKRARLNLAILSEEDGQVGAAVAQYEQLWELDQKDPLPAERLGEIRLTQNDAVGGIEWFAKALRADSARASAHEGLVRAQLQAGDTLTARLALQRWAEVGTDTSATQWITRAALWERTRQWDQARQSAQQALALDSSRVSSWLLLARILQREGSDATAVAVLRQSTRTLPKEGRLWKALGQAAWRAESAEEAYQALDRAITLNEAGSRDLLERMATWHLVRGEAELARRAKERLRGGGQTGGDSASR
ncbi:MAG: tetratricopeptide repeat protein [Fibrobacterota bacterium]|nr:tetratricopeptide repeat protein [Fibrobacterota bacterium]QQS05138.1 MAG: tetratricopeptide repeat protein [Fibrobacterota bacterium]